MEANASPHLFPILFDMNTSLSFADYRLLFESSILAGLNWKALESIDPSVSTRIISSRDELADVYTVWHRDAEAVSIVDWDYVGAVPQTIKMAALESHLWSPRKQVKLEQFRLQHNESHEPVVMMLPCYSTGSGVLLLDSTHRSVAAYLASVPVRFLLCVLEGPLDEEVLPDLRNHTS